MFQYRLRELGHTLDQLGAMFSLGYSLAEFLGTDFTADQNRYYIPYNLVFGEEMYRVMGALWALDEQQVSPKVHLEPERNPSDPTQVVMVPKLTFPVQVKGSDYITGFDYPKEPDLRGKQNVAPANITTTWTSRIYSLLVGMATFSINFDLDFAKQNQIIRLGGAEDLAVPSGWEKFEVEDLTSGTRYAALQQVGATGDTPAVRMVKIARSYAGAIQDPRTSATDRAIYTEYFRDTIRDLDLMRGYYNLFGRAF
jgi:hypothetical protein